MFKGKKDGSVGGGASRFHRGRKRKSLWGGGEKRCYNMYNVLMCRGERHSISAISLHSPYREKIKCGSKIAGQRKGIRDVSTERIVS